MNVHFKIRAELLVHIRRDLTRPHAFAFERVGFISAGISRIGTGSLMLLARAYHPVDDGDYVRDRSVGAMMGSDAIRKALQRTFQSGSVSLHVHCHEHRGRPSFSSVDRRENAKFVPNFFNVAAHAAHGALLLSHDSAAGDLWLNRDASPIPITRFSAIGAPLWLEGVHA